MSDYSPTSTPDPSIEAIAERERRDLRRSTGIGVLIAVPMAGSFIAFGIVEPDRFASLFLAAGILGGAGLISWMRHCGSGHDHHRLRRQNKSLKSDIAGLNAAIAALRIEQNRQLTDMASRFDSALRILAAQVAADRRDRKYTDAQRTVEKINQHLTDEVTTEHRPAMGQASLRLVGSTPAHGIRMVPLRTDDEEGALWPARGSMTG